MKRNIKSKILALSLVISALFSFSCGDLSEDSANPASLKKAGEGKGVISLSVQNESARTALPNYELTGFDTFKLEGFKDSAETATKTWEWPVAGDSGTAYTQLVAFSDEVDVGTWKFVLTGTKDGTVYSGTKESVEVSAGPVNTAIPITLKLTELATGTGSVKVNASASGVSLIKATISVVDETIALPVSYEATRALSSGTVTYEGLTAGYYRIDLEFYEDAAGSLLVGRLPESAVVTGGGTSVTTISLGNLDSSYAITYKDGDSVISGISPVSYTRFNAVTLPKADDVDAKKSDSNFVGWHASREDTAFVTQIDAGTVGEKEFYAEWISVAEEEDLVKVTINNGTVAVGNPLTANLWTNEGATTAFGGSVSEIIWYYSTSTAEPDPSEDNSWTAITATSERFIVPANAKWVKVSVKRTYKKSVKDSSTGNWIKESYTGAAVTATLSVAQGTLKTYTAAQLNELAGASGIVYNDGNAVVVGSTLSGSLSPETLEVEDINGNTVTATLGLAISTAPTSTSSQKVTLTASGYDVGEVENAVTINVKAAPPSTESLLATEDPVAPIIAKGYIKFASASNTLEYSIDDESTWKVVKTEEFIKPSSLKVRVIATDTVQASDPATVTINDTDDATTNNVGWLVKLVSVSFVENTDFTYGKTVYLNALNSDSPAGDITTAVSYYWYAYKPSTVALQQEYAAMSAEDLDSTLKALSPDLWTSVHTETYSESSATTGSWRITEADTANLLVGAYLKVVASQAHSNGNSYTATTYSTSALKGATMYKTTYSDSLVYAGGNSVLIGTSLSDSLIKYYDGSSYSAVELNKLTTNAETNGEEVTVTLDTTGVTAPNGKSKVKVLAKAHGYADLEIPVLVTVRAADPDITQLSEWLSTDVNNITYGYVKFTAVAASAHLKYTTNGNDWYPVTAGEVLKGNVFALKVVGYTNSAVAVSGTETGEVAESNIVDLTTVAYGATYLGKRSVKVISVTSNNSEIKLNFANNIVTASIDTTYNTTSTNITKWEINGVEVSGSDGIATTEGNILTFDPTKIKFTNGVTTAIYDVTVYGTRSTTNGSVTLTTTATVEVVPSSSGN